MEQFFDPDAAGELPIADIFPEEECVYETILTLFRRSGSEPPVEIPHLSALGVRRFGNEIRFTLFDGSTAFKSIEQNPVVCVNIPIGPDRIDVFMRSSLKGAKIAPAESEREFTEGLGTEVVEFYSHRIAHLSNDAIVLIVELQGIEEDEKRDHLGTVQLKHARGKVIGIKMGNLELPGGEGGKATKLVVGTLPYSRAEHSLMEALVVATRYRIAKNETGKGELGEELERHLRSAERFGGKRTCERAEWIRDRIRS